MGAARRCNWHEPFVFTDGRAYDVKCCLTYIGRCEIEWRCGFELLERRFQDWGELYVEYSRDFCDREYLHQETILLHARRTVFEYLLGCDARRGLSGASFATVLKCE
jgi:hypothetical protein